jgi:hypothetical protein
LSGPSKFFGGASAFLDGSGANLFGLLGGDASSGTFGLGVSGDFCGGGYRFTSGELNLLLEPTLM